MADRSKIMSNKIAGRIRNLRLSEGYTQKQLSEMLFKSESTVRMWELGKSEPDIETINKLSAIFAVSVDYLLGNSKSPVLNLPADVDNETVVIYHRDGKTVRREFTKEQMDIIVQMLDGIPDTKKGI